jgi:hypothetical protein
MSSAKFMKKDSPNTFIFLGCWNNINCKNKYLYRDIILYTIKEFELYTDKVFIAGDNWYNFVVNNNKQLMDIIKNGDENIDENEITHYVTPILISGYYSLYNMNKDVYLCAGNHDEAQDSQDLVDELKVPSNKNCMITTQKYFNAKIKNTEYLEFNKYIYNNYNNKEEENPIFKFIKSVSTDEESADLNLENLNDKYKEELKKQDKKNPDFNSKEIMLYSGDDIEVKSFDNYMVLIINTNNFKTDSDYISKIEEKLKIALRIELRNYHTKLEEYTDFDNVSHFNEEYVIHNDIIKKQKQVFVMGHFPLFYLKNKKSKKSVDLDKKVANTLNKNLEIDDDKFDEFYNFLAKYNCIYLCADCHNFNIMKITNNKKSVIQIMSGTGGANPDIINEVVGNENIILSGDQDYIVSDKKQSGLDIKYNIKYNTVNSYGYCKLILNKGKDQNIITTVVYNQLIKAEQVDDIDNNNINYIKYYHIIENNDVIFYKKQDDIAPLKVKEDFINQIALTSQYNKNVYCRSDYITLNHVIKSKNLDNPKICFNKKYKIHKQKKKDKDDKQDKDKDYKQEKDKDDKQDKDMKQMGEQVKEQLEEQFGELYGGKKRLSLCKKTKRQCIKLKIK